MASEAFPENPVLILFRNLFFPISIKAITNITRSKSDINELKELIIEDRTEVISKSPKYLEKNESGFLRISFVPNSGFKRANNLSEISSKRGSYLGNSRINELILKVIIFMSRNMIPMASNIVKKIAKNPGIFFFSKKSIIG